MRRMAVVAGAVMAMVLGSAVAATAYDGDGWHPVQEPWQPYEQGALRLPAERYCGDFDLLSEPTRQAVREKVLTRWDDGAPRTVAYAGPLVVTATNQATGDSVEVNLSGTATATYDETGAFDVYETDGPVGVGFPAGSNDRLEPGFYRLTGHHVIDFAADGSRTLDVDRGAETNICDLVS
jgi:hypothetical protein